jgi:hypothetical protein
MSCSFAPERATEMFVFDHLGHDGAVGSQAQLK